MILSNVECNFPILIKNYTNTATGDWLISGYVASISSNDRNSDKFLFSDEALEKSVPGLIENGVLFYDHDLKNPIGKFITVRFDKGVGLFIEAMISKTKSDIWTMIKEKILTGLSISGTVTKYVKEYNEVIKDYIRRVTDFIPLEGSIVPIPANCDTRIENFLEKSFKKYDLNIFEGDENMSEKIIEKTPDEIALETAKALEVEKEVALAKTKAEDEAKMKAEADAKLEEEKLKAEADAKAKADAEATAKAEADAKACKPKDDKVKKIMNVVPALEAMLAMEDIDKIKEAISALISECKVIADTESVIEDKAGEVKPEDGMCYYYEPTKVIEEVGKSFVGVKVFDDSKVEILKTVNDITIELKKSIEDLKSQSMNQEAIKSFITETLKSIPGLEDVKKSVALVEKKVKELDEKEEIELTKNLTASEKLANKLSKIYA